MNGWKGYQVGLLWLAAGTMLLGSRAAKADYVFGTPVNLGPHVNAKYDDGQPCVSADGLELYSASFREKVGQGSTDLWVTTRPTRGDEWGLAQNLGPVINTSTEDGGPALALDGLKLYFHSGRSGGLGKTDLWMAKRATRNDPWGPPANLGPPVNSADREALPFLSADGLELYFNVSSGTGANARCRTYVSQRAALSSPWGQRVGLEPEIDSKYYQDRPSVSSDGLVLLFSDTFSETTDEGFRPGGCGGGDLWLSRRATKESAWGAPINPGPPLNSAFNDLHGTIAPDGCAVYFSSSRCGGSGYLDVWQAPILPVVDLDQDGAVGMDDLVLLIEAWGTSQPRCSLSSELSRLLVRPDRRCPDLPRGRQALSLVFHAAVNSGRRREPSAARALEGGLILPGLGLSPRAGDGRMPVRVSRRASLGNPPPWGGRPGTDRRVPGMRTSHLPEGAGLAAWDNGRRGIGAGPCTGSVVRAVVDRSNDSTGPSAASGDDPRD